MGADGGSIPTRSDLVRMRGGGEGSLEESRTLRLHSWSHCGLSGEALKAPIVVCKEGRLFNKEAILHMLLERRAPPPSAAAEEGAASRQRREGDQAAAHISSLKDVQAVTLTRAAAGREGARLAKGEGPSRLAPCGAFPFVCPITGKEMNGLSKFVYLSGCGCVLAESALSTIASSECLLCGARRRALDVQPLRCDAPLSLAAAPPEKRRGPSCITSDPPRDGGEGAHRSKRPLPLEEAGPAQDAAAKDDEADLPYLPCEAAAAEGRHRPRSSPSAAFRKTAATGSLYK